MPLWVCAGGAPVAAPLSCCDCCPDWDMATDDLAIVNYRVRTVRPVPCFMSIDVAQSFVCLTTWFFLVLVAPIIRIIFEYLHGSYIQAPPIRKRTEIEPQTILITR